MNKRMEQHHRIIFVTVPSISKDLGSDYFYLKISAHLSREFDLLEVSLCGTFLARTFFNLEKSFLKGFFLFRFLKDMLFSIAIGLKMLRKIRSNDIVFIVTNPVNLLIIFAIIRKFFRFRLVLLVHDIFPENLVATGYIRCNNILYRFIKKLFDWAYSIPDRVITIGRDMSKVVAHKIVNDADKIVLIENWADHPFIEQIPRNQSMIFTMGMEDLIVIQYAGNFGLVQGLPEFVNLVSTIENDVVRFVFRGSGALSKVLHDSIQGHHRFIFQHSLFPRSNQDHIQGACDISLVTLASNMYGLGVPSKIYNILAAGKPVLFIGPKDSEIYQLVKFHEIGWAFCWSEASQLVEQINQWSIRDLPEFKRRGDKARKLVESTYNETTQLAKFSSLIRSLHKSNI
jgi:glycosyltransferase involved in cell wall biosynthesis